MNTKKLLCLDDLYNFYSTKRKSMTFSSEKSGYNIAVQTNGKFEVVESDDSEGLLYCRVRAFHDLSNKNKSYIETDLLEKRLSTMKDRPIMADIVDTEEKDNDGNAIKDFSGHTMFYDDELEKMVYVERPVGHFVNPEDFHIEYDKKYDRNFAIADCVVYEEYSDACDILRRRETTDCSVELVIRDMSWDCANKVLKINDFYVQGCTLLGADVLPGMDGSKLSLKDFAESNNSMFSSITDEEQEQLIEMREKIDTLLSRFNIEGETQENYGKEDENVEKDEIKVEEEVTETEEVEVTETEESTEEEVTETTTETESEETVETPEVVEDEACKKKHEEESEEVVETESEETVVETEEVEEPTEDPEEKPEEEKPEEVVEEEACGNKKKYSVEFELSHDDVRCALYQLLESFCESDNDWYWISEVFDDHFVYEGCMGNYFGQKYTKDGDTVAFDGERYELFAEFVTASEKAELEAMRANYSSITEKLTKYETAELNAARAEVFEDEAYAEFVETEGFKKIKENIDTYSVEDLRTACDLQFAKEVKAKGTFALNEEKQAPKKPSMFAFAKQDKETSFLDGLLKK